MDFPKISQRSTDPKQAVLASAMAQVTAGLGSQHNHSQAPLTPAQAATNTNHFVAPIRWSLAIHRQ